MRSTESQVRLTITVDNCYDTGLVPTPLSVGMKKAHAAVQDEESLFQGMRHGRGSDVRLAGP